MITLRQIEYSYSSELEGFSLGPIDLEIYPSRIYGWKGHNGSGKSTLATILAGEKAPIKGEVNGVCGKSYLFAQRIAENVFPELTVAQHFQLFKDQQNKDQVQSTFPELKSRMANYPDELSGGELQRLAFSMAFAQMSQLYIFDEVTNHLDPPAKNIVGAMLRDWVTQTKNRYVIFISHDEAFQKSYCDEIVQFDEGRAKTIYPEE